MNIERGPNIINLNTYVTVAGFIIMIAVSVFGWGVMYSSLQGNVSNNSKNIELIDKRLTGLETTLRVLDNHEIRIVNVEQQAAGTAQSLRALENSVSNLGSDVRVMKEILLRIEGVQKVR